MKRLGIAIILICVLLTLSIFSSFISASTVKAVASNPQPGMVQPLFEDNAEKIELTCQYPALSSYAGLVFSYDINILYSGGKEPRTFDLKATVPQGFNFTIAPGYGQAATEIAAIRLDPAKTYPDSVSLTVRPYVWQTPAPGEYPITFEASSGNLKASLQLKAIVTAKYDMMISTPDGRLNTEATAGKDNIFTVVLINTGSAPLEKITVQSPASNRPAGWTVNFKPEKIDSLPVGDSKEVQVIFRPSDKTIAGDYMMGVEAEPESKYAYANLQMRVTVLTPTIWGWVGVGVVVLVVLALAIMFIRFGRR